MSGEGTQFAEPLLDDRDRARTDPTAAAWRKRTRTMHLMRQSTIVLQSGRGGDVSSGVRSLDELDEDQNQVSSDGKDVYMQDLEALRFTDSKSKDAAKNIENIVACIKAKAKDYKLNSKAHLQTVARRISWRGKMFSRLFHLIETKNPLSTSDVLKLKQWKMANPPGTPGYVAPEDLDETLGGDEAEIKQFALENTKWQEQLSNALVRMEKDYIVTKADLRMWNGFRTWGLKNPEKRPELQLLSVNDIVPQRCAGMKQWLQNDFLHSKKRVLMVFQELYAVLNNTEPGRNEAGQDFADRGLEIIKAAVNLPDPDDVVSFLKTLSIQISDDDWMATREYQSKTFFQNALMVIPGTFTCKQESPFDAYREEEDEIMWSEDPKYQHPLDKLQLREQHHVDHHHDLFSFCAPERVWYTAHFCGVQGLFYGVDAGSEGDSWARRAMWMLELVETLQGEALKAPICQAIVRHHWNECLHEFMLERFLDLVSALLWSLAGYALHFRFVIRHWLLLVLLVLSMQPVLKVLLIFIGGYIVYGKKVVDVVFLRFWNVLLFFFDMFVPFVLIMWLSNMHPFWGAEGIPAAADDNIDADMKTFLNNWAREPPLRNAAGDTLTYKQSFPGLHPTRIFLCVGIKWVYLIINILNVEAIGVHMLPVYESLRQKQTLTFLLYLLMCSLAMSFAYFSYPLVDDFTTWSMSMERVMRLFWFGDFDIRELEGVDTVVQGPIRKTADGNWSADMTSDDGDDQPKLLGGIRFFVCFAAYLGPIVFLNTFITVLGNVYSTVQEQINEHFIKHRILALKTLMLQRLVRNNFLCRGPKGREGRQRKRRDSKTPAVNTGVWIRLPAYCLGLEGKTAAKTELDEVQDALSDQLGDLQNEVKLMKDLVKELNKKEIKTLDNMQTTMGGTGSLAGSGRFGLGTATVGLGQNSPP